MPNENEVISSWMAKHGHHELAWEPDTLICENGHFTESSTWHQSVGDPCMKGLGNCGKTLQHIPFDFAKPEPLLAAVKTVCDEMERTHQTKWAYRTEWSAEYASGEIFELPKGKHYGKALYPGDEYVALRAALADAIAAEQGGNYGGRA